MEGGFNLYAYVPNPTGWIDPWGWTGNPATATHVTYTGIDVKTGKPYSGYASMQGLHTPEEVIKYRYGNNFERYGGEPPKPIYEGYGQEGKNTARGMEHRTYEDFERNGGSANKQNPVGKNNPNRSKYLNAADEQRSGNSKKGGGKGC